MSVYEQLLSTVKYVRDRTGDPNAWQAGLAPNEVTAVITPTSRREQLEAVLRKIRQQHSDLFGAGTPGGPAGKPTPGIPEVPSERGEGGAAEAMADAEAALAHQNSASSQLDMQVISAILNAHLKAVEGREALTNLQRETEAAVLTRSDLDTPAGARDFQRFLIGKLKDIRAVVLNASLDDTSKSALMAAWTSLYDASKGGPNDPGGHPSTAAVPVADTDTGWDPLLDPMFADDPGLLAGDSLGQGPAQGATPAAMPMAPAMPTIPNFSAGLCRGWAQPRVPRPVGTCPVACRCPGCRTAAEPIPHCGSRTTKRRWDPMTWTRAITARHTNLAMRSTARTPRRTSANHRARQR